MDRYQKVEKPKVETPIDENEIRITSQGRMRSYITYAMTLLQEKGSDEIVFKAMGRAINKTVTIVELIKRRIVGLHQITAIQSTDITDTWEPLEEGLQILETTRKVSMVTITLSKKELDTKNIGYQPPIPADQVKVSTELDYDGEGSPLARGRGRGGRGRGRPRGGQSGNGYPPAEFDDGGYERNRGYARGRGRGRGRNFRGRGRGGYYGPQFDTPHDTEGYNQEAPRGTAAHVVAVGGGLVAGAVDSDLMGRSMLLREVLSPIMQQMDSSINEDIVIVGAGIAGLTTALGLPRLGIRSLVLESSEGLRIAGFALTMWTNAWRALDAVGIGNVLREKSLQIQGFEVSSWNSSLPSSEKAPQADLKL
ncbi:hypothetical protein DH2020_047333 [Rehmannia glutinosa]|uniref:DNA/RNA-binding protein Alba-like domain-containing protein n=1 Tax=Rehmannia glutinosa TaxID=99300 RepID=A0ABR0U8V3_REHGL